jgi:hypothetical protein
MKTLLKRVVIHAYCKGWVCASTVTKIFARFDLKEH